MVWIHIGKLKKTREKYEIHWRQWRIEMYPKPMKPTFIISIHVCDTFWDFLSRRHWPGLSYVFLAHGEYCIELYETLWICHCYSGQDALMQLSHHPCPRCNIGSTRSDGLEDPEGWNLANESRIRFRVHGPLWCPWQCLDVEMTCQLAFR